MIRFLISDFDQLKQDALGDVVADLQRIASRTPVRANALETLQTLRQGED